MKWIDNFGNVVVRLIIGKTKDSSLKTILVPLLKLCAALLLIKTVCDNMSLPMSTVVVHTCGKTRI